MKSFVVLGVGRFGYSLARTLYNLGHDVLVVDSNEEVIQDIADHVTHAVVGDCVDEATLRSLGVRNFDVVVVAIGGDLQSGILATVILKDIGVRMVVAKAQSELHARVLQRVGADRVVFPERDMGIRVANNLSAENILDHIELSPDYSIAEVQVPQKWVGKTLKALDVRAHFGITILACKNLNRPDIHVSPSADYELTENDVLVVLGRNEDLTRIKA